MTSTPPPICDACTRRRPRDDGPGWACDAFPAGIPEEISVDGFDHRRPYPGDGGVRFELDPARQASLWAYLDAKPAP